MSLGTTTHGSASSPFQILKWSSTIFQALISRYGISREAIGESVREADASGLSYYIVGHVGDGNYHVAYLIDPKDPGQWDTAEQLNLQLVQRALRLEGTCTGEHGVGLHKQGFLVEEAGENSVEVMRTLKRALDPKNILNPGKIFTL